MNSETTRIEEVPAAQKIFEMIWPGGLAAQAIYCAARLTIADRLAEQPKTVTKLADETETHPPSLRRLLRSLCSLGIVEELPSGEFSLADAGHALRSSDPGGAKAWADMLGAPFIWRPWGQLLETVKSGRPAFPDMYGHSMYEFLAEHPDQSEIYNTAMNAGSAMNASVIVQHYDFDVFDNIVDLGGGRGSLLRGILEANPHPRGILFDLPGVVETADEFRQSSVASRCEVIGGDFLDGVPADADAYLLKGIIHGFNDDHARKILNNIHAAMRPDGKVLIFDVVLSDRNEPVPQKAMMDLMMLALVEGRERTRAELETLLDSAGFSLLRIIDTQRGNSIVEAARKEA